MPDDEPGAGEPGPTVGIDPVAIDEETLELARRMFGLAREGASEELASFIEAGVPVNLSNEKGDSLLMLAAYRPHPTTVRMLLDHGADTSRVNDRGQTALGAAVFRQSAESVQALLAAGADPHLGGPSAVDVAHFFGLPAMLDLLTAEPGER
ncbi:MAG TPA: ankyrin repeat domain-containing protein [Acidimicrobiales bacterium]|nr:ankyrin repeat domain-containing protein [Acidimicrobiales bacterium]